MNTRTVKASVIAASLAMLALVLQITVSAHHSFAMYDQKKVVTLTGVVKQFVPQANGIPFTRVDALDAYLTGVGQQQPVHQLQHRRLACAARADERERLASTDGQREVVEDVCPAADAVGHVPELDAVHGMTI